MSNLDNSSYVRKIKFGNRISEKKQATKQYLLHVEEIKKKKKYVQDLLFPIKDFLTKDGVSLIVQNYLAYDNPPAIHEPMDFALFFGKQSSADRKIFGDINLFKTE